MDDKASAMVACKFCDHAQEIRFVRADYERWRAGSLIQNAMPYLTPSEREMMITQTCNSCWENMFDVSEYR